MTDRAYATLYANKGKVDVLFVNPQRQSFSMKAPKFLLVWKDQGRPTLIKRRDRAPEKAAGYHPGDIYALLMVTGKVCSLTLHYGELRRDMVWEERTDDPLHSVHCEQYRLPTAALKPLQEALAVMHGQVEEFKVLYEESRYHPDRTLQRLTAPPPARKRPRSLNRSEP